MLTHDEAAGYGNLAGLRRSYRRRNSVRSPEAGVVHGGWRGYGRWPGRDTEAFEDLADGLGWMDGTEDPHPSAASGAFQNVHCEDALEKFGPGVVPGAAGALVCAPGGGRREPLPADRTKGAGQGCGRRRLRFRDDERPESGGGGEHPVVPHEMEAGRGHEGGKPGHQVEGLEDDVAGAVAPAVPEAVKEPAVGTATFKYVDRAKSR